MDLAGVRVYYNACIIWPEVCIICVYTGRVILWSMTASGLTKVQRFLEGLPYKGF